VESARPVLDIQFSKALQAQKLVPMSVRLLIRTTPNIIPRHYQASHAETKTNHAVILSCLTCQWLGIFLSRRFDVRVYSKFGIFVDVVDQPGIWQQG
jgi:hypothetical protein